MGVSNNTQRLFILGVLPFLLLYPVIANSTYVKTSNSTVTVNTYIALGFSSGLEGTVDFGTLAPGENNQESVCVNNNCNITVSNDTNVNVDIFLKADVNLTLSGGNETIPAWAYTWNCTNGLTYPNLPGNALSVGSYDFSNKVGSDLSANDKISWMAWLDIPSDQAEGAYSNTLYFCANKQGTTACS